MVDRQMNTLRDNSKSRTIFSEYRARAADKWSDFERQLYKRSQQLAARYRHQEDALCMEESEYEAKYAEMDGRAIKAAKEMIADAEQSH